MDDGAGGCELPPAVLPPPRPSSSGVAGDAAARVAVLDMILSVAIASRSGRAVVRHFKLRHFDGRFLLELANNQWLPSNGWRSTPSPTDTSPSGMVWLDAMWTVKRERKGL